MTQKQIRRRREVIKAKMNELYLQMSRLKDELTDLQKQCAHSSRTEVHESRSICPHKKVEQCEDCGERFYYK